MKHAEVYLREEDRKKRVKITDSKKPEISSDVMEKWQRIINLMAKIINVPSGLLMNITEESMVVFVKSQNSENPYPNNGSDLLGHGLYCETVIGTDKELLVPNALEEERWKDNPDVKLNMISYYGLPLKWPDDEFFGTICVLDSKTNQYTDDYKELLKEFKEAIEADLKVLTYQKELSYIADMDLPTGILNRGKTEKIIIDEFERSKRTGEIFSVALIDINKLKEINDNNGHVKGDEFIKGLAQGINSRIRNTDRFGRWGGDEFLLICPDTDEDGMKKLTRDIKEEVSLELNEIVENHGFCIGASEYYDGDEKYSDALLRADNNLYVCKQGRR